MTVTTATTALPLPATALTPAPVTGPAVTGSPAPVFDVVAPGPLTTVQDRGRPGLSRWGVGESGAADRGAARRANRLVGNAEDAAVLEVTYGGLALRARRASTVSVTGTPCDVVVDGRTVGHHCTVRLKAGSLLRVGPPLTGVRAYVGVRGGVAADPVLGSRARDQLADLGPSPLAAGDVLAVGGALDGPPPAVTLAPVVAPAAGDVTVRVRLGPRDDWFTAESLAALTSGWWTVGPDSDRVGLRLQGGALVRCPRRDGAELPSEGVVRGSVQIAASGRPTVFLADHPVTGGYPVAAVVVERDLDPLAQIRAGQRLGFRVAPR